MLATLSLAVLKAFVQDTASVHLARASSLLSQTPSLLLHLFLSRKISCWSNRLCSSHDSWLKSEDKGLCFWVKSTSCHALNYPHFLLIDRISLNSDWPILHFMAKLMSSTWMISDACQAYDELEAGREVINYVLGPPLVLIRYFFLWIKWPIPCLHFPVELLSGRLEPTNPIAMPLS